MSTVSITQLKTSPSKVISEADEYPVEVKSRNKVKAYLVGKDLYEKMISLLEDRLDRAVIEETDFTKGEEFEKVAEELGI